MSIKKCIYRLIWFISEKATLLYCTLTVCFVLQFYREEELLMFERIFRVKLYMLHFFLDVDIRSKSCRQSVFPCR